MTDSDGMDYSDMSNPYAPGSDGAGREDLAPGPGVDPVRLIVGAMLVGLVIIVGVLLAVGIEPWIIAIFAVGDLIAMGVLSRTLRQARGAPR